ncbi:hypothetical protein COH21_012599 [Aspergillus flavus]|nr:hypothetical protein COH21_012599 [Aspergillus flavus]
MDLIFLYLDPLIFDYAYDGVRGSLESKLCLESPKSALCPIIRDSDLWHRQSIYRQSLSIGIVTWSFSVGFFLLFGTICYHQNFDKSLKKHPKYLKDQIRYELSDSLLSISKAVIPTVPILVAQVRGYAKLYDFGSGRVPWWYELAQFVFYVLFSDTWMYWMHRIFHTSYLFNLMHKKHHRYIIPTPFSAYAFHPLEAYIMSLPIYAYSFLWPMSREAQLIVFFTTHIWTVLLHDNRDQFHTVHHKNVKLNFGQYLTLWDHLGGTYVDAERYFIGKGDNRTVKI